MTAETDALINDALEALRRGFQVLPIQRNLKAPNLGNWTHITWDIPEGCTDDELRGLIRTRLRDEWSFDPELPFNIGVLLGPSSGDLVDVDIDYSSAKRFRGLLPRTMARSGRPGSPDSHYWYIVEDDGTGMGIPKTRRYKLADKTTVTIEYRYNGAQTVVPASDWVPKDWESVGSPNALIEVREWSREPWGGSSGPARISGRKLALQVALVGLLTSLLDGWPGPGSRHEAYLALAGALLRQADGIVHPFWQQFAEVVIQNLADATNDDDAATRVSEVIPSTIDGIRTGKMIWGWPKLAELIGDDQVANARVLMAEVESLAGFVSRNATGPAPAAPVGPPAPPTPPSAPGAAAGAPTPGQPASGAPAAPEQGHDGLVQDPETGAWIEPPVEEPPQDTGSWQPYDLDPYLNGTFAAVKPTTLVRADGTALFYPGRLNMLFAPSEAGKTLITLYTCKERIDAGERVIFIDFEDDPVNTIERLRAMGVSADDIRTQFTYIRPDQPIAGMQRDRWGSNKTDAVGEMNAKIFAHTIEQVDPALIVADGMTSIYGLHGLDSNNSVETDVITTWLKSLSRNGRTTVILIDHMAKAGDRGSMPIGSQHKVSMVQGTLLQVWPKPGQGPKKGGVGEVELLVLKDRPGEVRRNAGTPDGKAQLAATITIDSTGFWPDGSPSTIFTIADPPPASSTPSTTSAASGAAVPQGPLRPVAGLTPPPAVVAASTADRDREIKRKQDELFLKPWGNVAGTELTGSQINAANLKNWIAAGWTTNAFGETFMRLRTYGKLLKNGPERGPGITYELMPLGVK